MKEVKNVYQGIVSVLIVILFFVYVYLWATGKYYGHIAWYIVVLELMNLWVGDFIGGFKNGWKKEKEKELSMIPTLFESSPNKFDYISYQNPSIGTTAMNFDTNEIVTYTDNGWQVLGIDYSKDWRDYEYQDKADQCYAEMMLK